jgi:hypothetical protein
MGGRRWWWWVVVKRKRERWREEREGAREGRERAVWSCLQGSDAAGPCCCCCSRDAH